MNDGKIMSNKIENNLTSGDQADLAKLLRANLERTEEIFKMVSAIQKYLRWQQAWSLLRLLLIFVPLILAFIYLPPIFKDVLNTYQSFLR
ncbi:MAG: hypothetical protein WC863_03075 [Patescibacteria group bacterium]